MTSLHKLRQRSTAIAMGANGGTVPTNPATPVESTVPVPDPLDPDADKGDTPRKRESRKLQPIAFPRGIAYRPTKSQSDADIRYGRPAGKPYSLLTPGQKQARRNIIAVEQKRNPLQLSLRRTAALKEAQARIRSGKPIMVEPRLTKKMLAARKRILEIQNPIQKAGRVIPDEKGMSLRMGSAVRILVEGVQIRGKIVEDLGSGDYLVRGSHNRDYVLNDLSIIWTPILGWVSRDLAAELATARAAGANIKAYIKQFNIKADR